jgi:branched-chain amino acid aminotransferase
LADQKGLLTEGSRSNLFFIRDNQVISAPDERILLGITRKYVMQAITEAGAEMLTGLISKNEINDDNIDAAFLSGSPIDLLPISSIEDHQLKSADNDMFCAINQKYHMILREWLENHRHYGPDKN